jgi:hypothetical protein
MQKTLSKANLDGVSDKEELPSLPHSYAYPMPMPEHSEGQHWSISFPLADDQFHPPLFWPTEIWKGGSRSGFRHLKNAYQVLYATMEDMGYFVNRCPPAEANMVFDWSEKNDSSSINSQRIFIEHGWLPRSSYQLSNLGTNARSHIAKNFRPGALEPEQERYVLKQLSVMRQIFDSRISKRSLQKIKDFISMPFNLRYSNSVFSQYYSPDPQANIMFAQACVDYIENSSLSLPVVYKQHPADRSRLGDVLRIKNKDSVLIENSDDMASIDLLGSGQCKLVVAINSNTLHEALVFSIPVVALGTLLWDEDAGSRPFVRDLNQAGTLAGHDPLSERSILAYLYQLFSNQWYLSDFQNPLMVEQLVQTRANCVPRELRQRFGFGTTS